MRSRKGQSTVEFALMMPVLLAVFFWIFQANIIMTAFHMSAYASYASARSLVVCNPATRGMACEDWVKQETSSRILNGKLFTDSVQGNNNGGPVPADLKLDPLQQMENGRYQGAEMADGVRIELPWLASLPYVRGTMGNPMMQFDTYIPTHLGPSEWDNGIYNDDIRDQDGDPSTRTDNNQNDSAPSSGTRDNGQGNGGYGNSGHGHHGNNGNHGNGNNGNHGNGNNGHGHGNGHGFGP